MFQDAFTSRTASISFVTSVRVDNRLLTEGFSQNLVLGVFTIIRCCIVTSFKIEHKITLYSKTYVPLIWSLPVLPWLQMVTIVTSVTMVTNGYHGYK